MSKLLEELYASPEVEVAFERGRKLGLKQHVCPKVRTKMVFRVRKEHIRSRHRPWGVVSNGRLLNPSFNTEAEAAVFLAGLVPANPAQREHVKIDAQVIRLR